MHLSSADLMRPRSGGRNPRPVLPAMAMALAVLCFGLDGHARAGPLSVASDLERLQLELAALRRIQPTQGGDAGQLARFEVRLGRLEEELRQLTGRVERLEHGQRSLERRIDELVADLDQRLAALEQGGGGAQRATESGAAAAEPPPPEEEATDGTSAAVEGALGVIPESALRDLPRTDPAAAVPPRRTRLPPEEQYDSAMDLLRTGDYTAAERGLELFLEVNPDDALAPNAAYWLAETYYVRKNYAAAAAAFARNYRSYGRDSGKAVDNLLKLGMSLEGLGEAEKACLAYQELSQEFPNAPTHIQQAVARERAKAECV
jgi:tol-pal system protein YbgF